MKTTTLIETLQTAAAAAVCAGCGLLATANLVKGTPIVITLAFAAMTALSWYMLVKPSIREIIARIKRNAVKDYIKYQNSNKGR